jgi:hypothetical protein
LCFDLFMAVSFNLRIWKFAKRWDRNAGSDLPGSAMGIYK